MQVSPTDMVCVQCGSVYSINNQINFIEMTKCLNCSQWFFKDNEVVCDCRKIGYSNEQ